jgi:hypothetical protein
MLFTLTIFALHNFFMLELLFHEKLNHINQHNSPLGNNIDALMIAYNFSHLPVSSRYSRGRLNFLTDLCEMVQIEEFSDIKIIPTVGSWSSHCNLTAASSIKSLSDDNIIYIGAIIVANMFILVMVLIFLLLMKFSSFRITYKVVYPTLVAPYIVSLLVVSALQYNLIIDVSVSDEVVPGANYLTKIHNILVWCGYILFNALIFGRLVYIAKPDKLVAANTIIASENESSQYYYDS